MNTSWQAYGKAARYRPPVKSDSEFHLGRKDHVVHIAIGVQSAVLTLAGTRAFGILQALDW